MLSTILVTSVLEIAFVNVVSIPFAAGGPKMKAAIFDVCSMTSAPKYKTPIQILLV